MLCLCLGLYGTGQNQCCQRRILRWNVIFCRYLWRYLCVWIWTSFYWTFLGRWFHLLFCGGWTRVWVFLNWNVWLLFLVLHYALFLVRLTGFNLCWRFDADTLFTLLIWDLASRTNLTCFCLIFELVVNLIVLAFFHTTISWNNFQTFTLLTDSGRFQSHNKISIVDFAESGIGF